jgi:magnesium transporter
MLTIYDRKGSGFEQRQGMVPVSKETVWIDLINPTVEEDAFVEQQLGIAVPTRAESREIEASSRLYFENGAHVMTAFIIYNADAPVPSTSTLTFILAGDRLVTVRYSEPKAFPLFLARVEKGDIVCTSAASVLIGLIETIIHRAADLVERIQDEVEKLAHAVFAIKGGQQTRTRRLDVFLKTIGKEGDMTSRAQESAISLDRVLTYFQHAVQERRDDPAILQRIEIAHRDAASLMESMRFLSSRIAFLLDATLGMISIEQNAIIKVFSVASVALMPPTLIASIYGMNFKHIPELDWPWGYPLAIVVMVASAIGPFVYFRRKGWF